MGKQIITRNRIKYLPSQLVRSPASNQLYIQRKKKRCKLHKYIIQPVEMHHFPVMELMVNVKFCLISTRANSKPPVKFPLPTPIHFLPCREKNHEDKLMLLRYGWSVPVSWGMRPCLQPDGLLWGSQAKSVIEGKNEKKANKSLRKRWPN